MTDKERYYYIVDKEGGDYLDGPFDTLEDAVDSFDTNGFNKEECDIESVEYDEAGE